MNSIIVEKQEPAKAFWNGKKVLITGGTEGLGKALTEALIESGAKVVIVARSKENLEKMQKKLPQLTIIAADVSEKGSVYKITGQTIGQLDGIDVLINNASSLGKTPLQLLVDTECEDLEKVLETNVIGPFRIIKAILPTMLLKNNGLIINISSDAAVSTYSHWGGYSISKAALDHLTGVWKEELSGSNINIVSIDPGDMNTAMHLTAVPDADVTELYSAKDVAVDFLRFFSRKDFKKYRYSAEEWRNLI